MRGFHRWFQFSVFGATFGCSFFFHLQIATAADSGAPLGKCRLFTDGRQEMQKAPVKVTSLKSVLMKCSNGIDSRVATRELTVTGEKLGYYLLVDPQLLQTSIERQDCFRCQPTELKDLASTRFGAAVSKTWSASEKKDAKVPVDGAYVNAGFRVGAAPGSYLTADLCPSHNPLDRDFLQDLKKIQSAAPIALSVSGLWMEKHVDDLQWLKSEVADGSLNVTWMNHSYHHTYDPDGEDDVGFMRTKGTNVKVEILRTERVMIENGLTPSVFFRFPGLVSDEKLMRQLKSYTLIPIGSGAWLQQLQMPKQGTIMLIHANGNEPGGLARFKTLYSRKQIPLPLLSLTKAP